VETSRTGRPKIVQVQVICLGADDLSPRILNEIKDEIWYSLAVIMQSSIDSGIIPSDWKVANVTPVYKKGSKSRVENYRPISLTSQICKIFEMIVRDSVGLSDHLDRHGLVRSLVITTWFPERWLLSK